MNTDGIDCVRKRMTYEEDEIQNDINSAEIFNMHVPARIVVIGPSGSGKSACCSMLSSNTTEEQGNHFYLGPMQLEFWSTSSHPMSIDKDERRHYGRTGFTGIECREMDSDMPIGIQNL